MVSHHPAHRRPSTKPLSVTLILPTVGKGEQVKAVIAGIWHHGNRMG
jgi:hypothetical protein